ncbi:hypothetical protein HYDPIDRAFT_103060 [Hydnomerulius pinastri MD-312]|uniref:CxC6 like cysteine cluster associated with KDZ domain-containing protein n=1 Tax=Hydnomerulius pinastri MD-312 TaxID=994086 RepID=A0A0C9VL01_9AGAM|nr:hypothetical protein HYDPIDRAFT_103060 [Hydnomerulius pinastri MD-312]
MLSAPSNAFEALSSIPIDKLSDLNKVFRFVRFSCLALLAIHHEMHDITHPPLTLPTSVEAVLVSTTGMDLDSVRYGWLLLKRLIWSSQGLSPSSEEVEMFNLHGLRHGVGKFNIATLSDPVKYQAARFTLGFRVLPVHSTSTYCCHCHRCYHYNYMVHKDSDSHIYYSGVPDIVQAAAHFFIDSQVLEIFANAKVFGWLSSLNCARIYNVSIADRHVYIRNNPTAFPQFSQACCHLEQLRATWPVALEMRDVDVLNGFFIYSLLLDRAERCGRLVLPHDATQKERIEDALIVRNRDMEGTGQEAYYHACSRCFVIEEDGGEESNEVKIQVAVCDGNTIGHPCCSVQDCKVPLSNVRHRYCSFHQGNSEVCAVDKCDNPRSPNSQTCAITEHMALEEAYFQPAKALFQLRRRLQRAGVTVPSDSISPEVLDSEEVTLDVECNGKPEEGNRKLQARFGCRRTHNEQVMMRPCGVILARATFFGSEAVSAVNDFAKAVFPTARSTPEFLVFDNNCKLRAHQEVIRDSHFSKTGMPVDVFHFNSKHKETDIYCQKHCNPAFFPELIQDGKWCFNTSICEQTNVWLGGYQAILRNMSVHRYNFYLDELIKRCNRFVIQQLAKGGQEPWIIPVAAIFPVT